MPPLEKQIIDIALAVGIDTKTDPKQTVKLHRMENCHVQRTGEIRQRKFLTENTEKTIDLADSGLREEGNAPELIEAYAIYDKNGQPIIYAKDEDTNPATSQPNAQAGEGVFYPQAPGGYTWYAAGDKVGMSHISEAILRETGDNVDGFEENPSIAFSGTQIAYLVGKNSNRDVGDPSEALVYVFNLATGTLERTYEIDAGGAFKYFHGRIHWVDSAWVVLGADAFYGFTLPADQPSDFYIWSSATETVTSISGSPRLQDSFLVDDNGSLSGTTSAVALVQDSGDAKVIWIGYDGTVLKTNTYDSTDFGGTDPIIIGGFALDASPGADSEPYIYLVFQELFVPPTPGTIPVWSLVLDREGATEAGPTQITTYDRDNNALMHITGAGSATLYTSDNVSDHNCNIALVFSENDSFNRCHTEFIALDENGAAISAINRVRNVKPLSRMFIRNNLCYLFMGRDSDISDESYSAAYLYMLKEYAILTSFLSPTLVNTMFYGRIPSSTVYGLPVEVINTSGEEFFTAFAMLADFTTAGTGIIRNIKKLTFTFDQPSLGAVASVMPGGMLGSFAGSRYAELGMHAAPDKLALTEEGSGSTPVAGVYSYKALYQWVDEEGNSYVSAPSLAVNIVTSGDGQIDIEVPPMPENSAKTKRSDVRIVVYRSEAGPGTVFRRVGALDNDINEWSVTFEDTLTDDELREKELLYTTGGELPNNPPPSSSIIAADERRLYVVPDDDQEALWYSKVKLAGVGYSFSEYLQLRFPNGGPITGIASMDGNFYVFKANHIFVFGGAGPDAAGRGGFATAQEVPTVAGCTNPASIIRTDVGIFFQSDKGIYLLDRSRRVSYAGSLVEDYNSSSIVNAMILPSEHRILFQLDDDATVLVYDHFHQLWSTYDFATGSEEYPHSALVDGIFTMLRGAGYVAPMDSTGASALETNDWVVETTWMALRKFGNFQRVWWLYLLGEFVNQNDMTIELFYDYDESEAAQTIVVDSRTQTTTAGEVEHVRIKPIKQKCKAIKLRITVDPAGDTQHGLYLSGMRIDVGAKKKLPLRRTSTF